MIDEPNPSLVPPLNESRSLLVVEDEAPTREILHYLLTRAGYNVWMAENGRVALELLMHKPCDMIVCDVMMPEMDGFTLRELVRGNPRTREIPFIFLTARSQSTDQIRGLESGVEDYITKPFEPAVLKARVEAVLRRRAAYARSSCSDPLTRLLNRHALEQEIRKSLERVQRYGEIGSMLFLDIDNFKKINDTYGHAMGDRVLVRFAEMIQAHSRQIDIAGRYGGEEFVLYLPQTDLDGARAVTQRMMESFRTADFEAEGLSKTFSAGVSLAPAHGTDFSLLCARADHAMYQAKNTGKARLVVWSEDLEPQQKLA